MKYLSGRTSGASEKKGYAADGIGSIDTVRECTIDKRSIGKDRKGYTAHTGITA